MISPNFEAAKKPSESSNKMQKFHQKMAGQRETPQQSFLVIFI